MTPLLSLHTLSSEGLVRLSWSGCGPSCPWDIPCLLKCPLGCLLLSIENWGEFSSSILSQCLCLLMFSTVDDCILVLMVTCLIDHLRTYRAGVCVLGPIWRGTISVLVSSVYLYVKRNREIQISYWSESFFLSLFSIFDFWNRIVRSNNSIKLLNADLGSLRLYFIPIWVSSSRW